MKFSFEMRARLILFIFISGLAFDLPARGAGIQPPLPPISIPPPGGSTPIAPPTAAVGNCVPSPGGLVGWWPGEGNANDIVGGNDGSVPASVTYGIGAVGQAFSFSGDDCITVADAPTLNPTNEMTLELWVYPLARPSYTWSQNLFGKDGECGNREYKLIVGDSPDQSGTGNFRAHIGVPGGFVSLDGMTVVQTNTWYHIAQTYDGETLKLYVNGQLDAQMAVTGPIIATTEPLRIGGGATGCYSPYNFIGEIDEPAIYNRALSSNEIAAIYLAGSAGKCSGPFPPQIVAQPASQTALEGGSVDFNVVPAGTGPFSFQWTFNGHTIAGATNVSLSLTNLHPAQAGNYGVKITSPFGATNSAGAVLTVLAQNILVYKYSGVETIVTTGENLTFPYSGMMFFLPANTNGTYVGWATIQGKKTYWVNPIAQSLWLTISGVGSRSYTLFGDAGSGFDDNGQAHFRCNLIKGWNTTLTIGTRKTFVFPNSFAGENTHAWPDSQTGRMKLDLATSTFTFAAVTTQTANNTGQTLADLIIAQVKLLKIQGYQLQ